MNSVEFTVEAFKTALGMPSKLAAFDYKIEYDMNSFSKRIKKKPFSVISTLHLYHPV
jgi:hypothetical protein